MAGKKRARPDKEVSKEVEDTEDAVHESASADQEEDAPPADDGGCPSLCIGTVSSGSSTMEILA